MISDEATSTLDYESEAITQRHTAAICRGRTVIMVAHRVSAVGHASSIVVMDKGRIVGVGPHEASLTQGGVYVRVWPMQSAGACESGAVA